jgi:hypothetical protein
VAIGCALAMAVACDASWAKAPPRLKIKSMKNQTGAISVPDLTLSSVTSDLVGWETDMALDKKHDFSIKQKACPILRSL